MKAVVLAAQTIITGECVFDKERAAGGWCGQWPSVRVSQHVHVSQHVYVSEHVHVSQHVYVSQHVHVSQHVYVSQHVHVSQHVYVSQHVHVSQDVHVSQHVRVSPLLRICTGDNQVVVAGGAESMSNVPHYLPGARRGLRLGGASLLDGLLVDGLTDAAHAMHMGDCAELCAEEHSISRGELDEHALAAHARSRAAAPLAAREIVPVQLPPGRSGGEAGTLCEDEPLARLDEAKLRSMAPHFKQARMA
jgi:Thiolase, N-terminal domain